MIRPASVVLSSLILLACGSAGGGDTPAGASHPLIGSPGPSFAMDATGGAGKINFGSYKGKVVVVDFWATWCDPCKKSFPKLQDLYTKYKASGMEMVGISEDDEGGGITEFGTAHGAKFLLGWDKDKSIAGQWQPKSMPSTFIVDRNGVVRFAHLGYHDGDEAEMEKEIKSLL
jgi:cytochrome c biogenesis protein CcmG/thiol:disulfide interchange protein DsbE